MNQYHYFLIGFALGAGTAPAIMGAWYLGYFGSRALGRAAVIRLRRRTWI